jgi:hypothetical protein
VLLQALRLVNLDGRRAETLAANVASQPRLDRPVSRQESARQPRRWFLRAFLLELDRVGAPSCKQASNTSRLHQPLLVCLTGILGRPQSEKVVVWNRKNMVGVRCHDVLVDQLLRQTLCAVLLHQLQQPATSVAETEKVERPLSTVLVAAAKSRTLEPLAFDEYCRFDTTSFA